MSLCRKRDAHHGNGLGVDHDFRRDGGEVGQVGENVHHRHYRHGYDDGQGQVPVGGGGQRSDLLISDSTVFMRSVVVIQSNAIKLKLLILSRLSEDC